MNAAFFRKDDFRNIPTYRAVEAAYYLRIPVSTLRSWALGQSYPTQRGLDRMEPLFPVAQTSPLTLSFWNVVEAYVLTLLRRRHHVSLQQIRKAVDYFQQRLGSERPLIHQRLQTNGVEIFAEIENVLINASRAGQVEIRQVIEAHLLRIDWDPAGAPISVSPWIRNPSEPRLIEIHPARAFGRLTVAGTGIPVDVLADRFLSGDTLDDLARDYRLRQDQVEEALRFDALARKAA